MLVPILCALAGVAPADAPKRDMAYALSRARDEHAAGWRCVEAGDLACAVDRWRAALEEVPESPDYCRLRGILARDLAEARVRVAADRDRDAIEGAAVIRRRHLERCGALPAMPVSWEAVEPEILSDATWTADDVREVTPAAASRRIRIRLRDLGLRGVSLGVGLAVSGLAAVSVGVRPEPGSEEPPVRFRARPRQDAVDVVAAVRF